MSNHEASIMTYRPNLPETHWRATSQFVRSTVRTYSAGRNSEAVRVGLITLAGFADWVFTTAIAPLNSAAFRMNVINAYWAFRTGEVAPRTATQERYVLLELGGLSKTPPPTAIPGKSHRPRVYGEAELARIRDWARWQPGRFSRISAQGLIGLSLGAGLGRAELILMHRKHVKGEGTRLRVDVPGSRARTVSVDPQWAEALTYAAEATSGYLLAPRCKVRGSRNFSDWFNGAQGAAPLPSLMRNTWLLARINEDHTADELARMAGLKDARSLDDLIYGLAPHRRELLRGLRSAL